MNNMLTAPAGIKVGHWISKEARSGYTLCPPEGCVASRYVPGAAPDSREYTLLEPAQPVKCVLVLLSTGCSAYRLAA